MNDGPAPFDVRHVLQAYGTYDLPFGRGRRYNIENGVLNAIAGGWTFGAIFTAQSGTPFRLTSGRQTVNGSDAGVVLDERPYGRGHPEADQTSARTRRRTLAVLGGRGAHRPRTAAPTRSTWRADDARRVGPAHLPARQ